MNEEKLIKEYIKNGVLDIDRIIKEYTPYVYKVILNKTSMLNSEDIEEIISDVFLTLWSNEQKLDINKNLTPYIAGITKNLIKKKRRNQRDTENIDDYYEKLILSENIKVYSEDIEKNERVLEELNKLKDEEKEIFMLFYYEDMKIREISKSLNISESKVKSKLSRTRKKLKKIIKGKEV